MLSTTLETDPGKANNFTISVPKPKWQLWMGENNNNNTKQTNKEKEGDDHLNVIDYFKHVNWSITRE